MSKIRSRIVFLSAVCALCAGEFGVHAATRWWNPTVKASNGRYNWNVNENWLDDGGAPGQPQTGDTVVMTNDTSVWLIAGTQLHAFILRPKTGGQGLSGTSPTFAEGSDGIRLETAQTVSYWLALTVNCDVPVYVCEGGTLSFTENYRGSGRFIKRGPGIWRIGTKTTEDFTWHGTVVEDGTLWMGDADMKLDNHDFVLAGPARVLLTGASQTLRNVDFHETDAVRPGTHYIDASEACQLIFTGTPARQTTTFTGRLDRKAGITWSPDSADYSFVFSKATSGTEGTLAVTEGTVRLADGATFVQLGALDVAANGTFAVDAGSGMGFRAGTMTLASGATLALGDGVKILAASATYAGNALADGTYTSADGVGVTGNGILVVRASPPAASSAVWTGGGETASATDPANWGAETLPALDDGSLTATFAGGGSTALLGAGPHLDFAGWNLSGGFTFAAAEGAGYVELEAGGITAADAAAPTPYTLGWPLVLHGAQTWTLGQNNTLHIHAPLVGAGGLTVNGKGCVNFSTPSSYAGDVLLTNGTFYVTATNAVGGPGGTLQFTPGFGTLHFGGKMALDRPYTAVIDADDDYKPTYIDADASVDFNQKVYFQNRQRSINVGDRAVVRFHGGFTTDRCFRFNGNGTVVVDTVPLHMGDRMYVSGPTIELNVANNRINGWVGDWSSGKIKTGVPYALRHEVPTGSAYQRILLRGATIDLCGNAVWQRQPSDEQRAVQGVRELREGGPAELLAEGRQPHVRRPLGDERHAHGDARGLVGERLERDGVVRGRPEGAEQGGVRPAGGRPHRRRGRADAPGLLRQHEGVRTLHRRAEAASWRLRRHGVGRPQETRVFRRHGYGPAGRPRRRHRHDGDLPMKRTYRSGRFRSSPCRARSCRASGEMRGKL